MKNIFFCLTLLSCTAFNCKKEAGPAYRFKKMTQNYIVFFGQHSCWEYGIEGFDGSQKWYAFSSIAGLTDGTTMGGKTRYDFFAASLGTAPDLGLYPIPTTISPRIF